jgi:hypothetical protein
MLLDFFIPIFFFFLPSLPLEPKALIPIIREIYSISKTRSMRKKKIQLKQAITQKNTRFTWFTTKSNLHRVAIFFFTMMEKSNAWDFYNTKSLIKLFNSQIHKTFEKPLSKTYKRHLCFFTIFLYNEYLKTCI